MEIAIIGGGLTGLTAAFELSKAGHKVTLFEKEKSIGGLAGGFIRPNWDWHLECSYHHLFTNDDSVLSLMDELGLTRTLLLKRPETSTYTHNTIYQFDSASKLLAFPYLSMIDKARTALLLAFCKLNPFWRPLESLTAKKFCMTIGGKHSWKTIWEPLMVGKFGNYSDSIAASWLWARIHKRTPSLYYIEGGFHTLISALQNAIEQHGGIIRTGCDVHHIEWRMKNDEWRLKSKNKHNKKYNSQFSILHSQFDSVLLTTPTPIAQMLLSPISLPVRQAGILSASPIGGQSPISQPIPHLHAQTLILETKEPILKDAYWLNITNRSFPFLAVVAHTNMIDRKHYGGNHITYFGNYLPTGHPFLSMNKEQLLNMFDPFIKKFNSTYRLSLVTYRLFTAPYAQPVHQLHYSTIAPKLNPPAGGPNLYLANLDSIFPWDRGTNYAVELGQKVAKEMQRV